jgi:hypothetical protein
MGMVARGSLRYQQRQFICSSKKRLMSVINRKGGLTSKPFLHRWLAQNGWPLGLRSSISLHSAQKIASRCSVSYSPASIASPLKKARRVSDGVNQELDSAARSPILEELRKPPEPTIHASALWV